MKKISALAIAGVFAASLAGTAFAEMADVKISGEIRIRDEIKNNYDYNNDLGDATSMIVQRTRVNVDAKVDEKTKAFVSLENNRDWGTTTVGTSAGTANTTTGAITVPDTNDAVSLYEGYVVLDKLFDQPLFFKAGRQKIALGNQRLIGANDWGAGQAFDGWILGYNADAVAVNGFSVTASDKQSTTPPGSNAYVNGIYATIKSVPVTGIDVYAIQKQNFTAGQSFITFGARANGAAANIDWDAELALQSGDSSASAKKNASAIWLIAGYSLPEVSKLRIGAEYDQLSGQGTGTDDTSFDLIAPTKHSTSAQHSVYGITDIVENKFGAGTGQVNGLKAMSLNVSAQPVEGVKLLAEYWNFSSAEDSVNASATKFTTVGSEMNLQVWYDISRSTNLHAYYAAFTPNSDFSGTTTAAATDAVLQLCVKF